MAIVKTQETEHVFEDGKQGNEKAHRYVFMHPDIELHAAIYDRLPSFANIKREFDAVYNQASAGDLFFSTSRDMGHNWIALRGRLLDV